MVTKDALQLLEVVERDAEHAAEEVVSQHVGEFLAGSVDEAEAIEDGAIVPEVGVDVDGIGFVGATDLLQPLEDELHETRLDVG